MNNNTGASRATQKQKFHLKFWSQLLKMCQCIYGCAYVFILHVCFADADLEESSDHGKSDK